MPRPPKDLDQSTFIGQVGARIRARRVRRKLSVEEAAAAAGAAVPSWYHWECGTRLRLESLPAIAAALGCQPRALLPQ